MDPPLQDSPLPLTVTQRFLPARRVKVEPRKYADLSGLSSSRSAPPPYDRKAKRKRDAGRNPPPLLASPDQSGGGSPFLLRSMAAHPCFGPPLKLQHGEIWVSPVGGNRTQDCPLVFFIHGSAPGGGSFLLMARSPLLNRKCRCPLLGPTRLPPYFRISLALAHGISLTG